MLLKEHVTKAGTYRLFWMYRPLEPKPRFEITVTFPSGNELPWAEEFDAYCAACDRWQALIAAVPPV